MRRLTAKRSECPLIVFPVLGLALLLAAWIVATQPWQAPDEASHYQRAMSIVDGRILGPKVDYTTAPMTSVQHVFLDHDTRGVMMPAQLSPPNVVCANGNPDLRGSCLEEDPNGNFPPLPYLLPAVALSISHHASSAIWLVRAASALPSLAFLLLAVALLWNGTGWSLLGFLAATSPMVFFSSSVMNSSGVQITACVAFAAAILRISRAPARAPRWAWLAFAVAGSVTILAGPIGLEFAIINIALFVGLLGRGGLGELRTRTVRRELLLSAVSLLTAVVIELIYSRIAGFAPTFGVSPFLSSLRQGVDQLRYVLHDAVGTFGSLTVPLPLAACWIWWLLVLSLVAAAVWLGDRRDRLVIAVVAVAGLAFPVLFYAWIDRFTGFGLQGREVLPLLMLIPLVAGEIVNRRSSRIAHRWSARLALGSALALIAAFQAFAWWYAARAAAGAPGTIRFYAHATWSPPLGWLPWMTLAALGTASLGVFAAAEWTGGMWLSTRPSAHLATDGVGTAFDRTT